MKLRVYWMFLVVAFASGCQDRPLDVEVVPERPTVQLASTPVVPAMIDFHVRDLRLGDKETDVVKIFGRPRKRTISNEDICGISPILKLRYDGIEFWLDAGNDGDGEWLVLEIRVDSPDIVVSPGARIGDTSDSIRQRFGSTWSEKVDKDSIRYSYLTKNNDLAVMEFRGKFLKRIRLYINPC